jgi:tetratricopeptide (TPR) repeat protein
MAKYLYRLEYLDMVFSFVLRPVAYLTFRLNYLISGQAPWSYRIFNIVIHISNAIILYEILKLTIRERNNVSEFVKISIPFFTALIFLVHPLQTDSVTAVIQRFSLLGTFFYLVTIWSYLISNISENLLLRSWAYYILSIVALILGLFSKEIAITAPVTLFCFDVVLMRRPWRRTLLQLTPHLICMSLIPLRLLFITEKVKENNIDTAAIIGSAYTRYEYAVTQLRVVLSYIRLLVLPYNQNMDPDYPLYRTLLNPEIIISIMIWVCILATGVQLLRSKERNICTDLAGFSIFWFILSISPSSSIVPLTDLMFEHHTYLPSIAFCIGSVAYLHHCLNSRRSAAISLICIVTVFGVLTVRRNHVYNNTISIYSDTVEKSPNKYRPNYALGNDYYENSQFDQAIPFLVRAIDVNPRDNVQAYLSLGEIYRILNKPQIAVELYKQYLATHPINKKILMNLAWTYANSEKLAEAIDVMQLLLSSANNEVQMLSFTAELYLRAGNKREAENYINKAREADRLDASVDISDKLNQIEKLIQQ